MSIGATIGFVGLVISAARRTRATALTGPEHALISTALALALGSLVATLLALFGCLSAASFGASCVGLTAISFASPISRATATPPPLPPSGLGTWLMAGVLVLGVGLRADPMDNPLGGRDPGSYTLRAQQTLASGTLDYHDELLEASTRAHHEAPRAGLEDLLGSHPIIEAGVRVDRYEAPYRPGFYLADRDRGRVEPQFFHLYPGALTVSGLVLGAERLHFISPLIAALALGLWACIALRIFAGWPARIACLGLIAVNPLAVWTARQTLSEGVYGLWVAAALLLCIAAMHGETRNRLVWPLCAGFLLACATWVRGDAWVWAPLVALALWGRQRRPHDGAFVFVVLFALGVVLHAFTSFAYLHDELLRRWPAGAPPTPAQLSAAAVLGAGLWLMLDRWFATRPSTKSTASTATTRSSLALVLLLSGAYAGLRLLGDDAAPYSRLDPLIPAAGPGWLALALVGLVWAGRRDHALHLRPYLPFALIALSSLALFVPRQLPTAGLYYYGRYLTPVVLPALALAAALLIEALAQRRARLAGGTTLALLALSAWPLLSSAQTLMKERRGAAEAVERIAAHIDGEAIVIAGGEGWHRGFTFNQIAGALAMREGVQVLPYRDRQRTHAIALDLLQAGLGDRRPSVFVLINEASHHYTRPDDERIVAGADDIISAPLRAKSVHHFEFWLDYLTPDPDAVPLRITRDGMRMSLIELEIDPERAPTTTRFEAGDARGGQVRLLRPTQADRWRAGRLCLHPSDPTVLEFESPDPRGGEFMLEMHPGTPAQNVAAALRLDGQALSVHAPELGSAARGTLGPFAFGPGKHRLELFGGGLEGPGPCPRGGLASISVLAPPRRAGASLVSGRADGLSLHRGPERGHPVKHSDWTSAMALTRFRSGIDPKTQVHGLSLRVRPDQPLEFPSSWLPGVDLAPRAAEYDVIVTLTASHLSSGAKLRLVLDELTVQDSELPLPQTGNWQTPKLRWTSSRPRARARLELIDAAAEDFADVRDLTFFLRAPLVTSVRNPT